DGGPFVSGHDRLPAMLTRRLPCGRGLGNQSLQSTPVGKSGQVGETPPCQLELARKYSRTVCVCSGKASSCGPGMSTVSDDSLVGTKRGRLAQVRGRARPKISRMPSPCIELCVRKCSISD